MFDVTASLAFLTERLAAEKQALDKSPTPKHAAKHAAKIDEYRNRIQWWITRNDYH